ncbi:MAG: TonB-dependent receptor [Pseudomonadota bacterium]
MSSSRARLFRVLTLASACAMAYPLAAQAQNQAGGITLEEIIVTAQRRSENLQDVPVTVSTLSGERLDNIFLDGSDIRGLASRVPSLNVESSNGRVAPRFYIRGLGNTDFDLAASQPVSIIMDEVVMENVVLKSFPLFDIAQVEVLKGPQGTLFGRNTPAGIVKFETRKPTEEFEAYGALTYGSMNTVTAQGAVSGALVPGKLAARVSGLLQRRSDYVDNGFTDEDDAMGGFREFATRLQLLFTPTDSFSALLNFHYRDLNGTSALFRANILGPGNNKLNDNFARKTVFFDEGNNNPQAYEGWGSNLKLENAFDGFTVTSITAFETTNGFSLGDIDGGFGAVFLPPFGPGFIPFPAVTQDGIDDLDQVTQEIRFASNSAGPLRWQFGGFYFNSDLTITTDPFFIDPTTVRHKNTSWALFGQGSYDLSEALTLTAGLRYTDDKKDFSALAAPVPTADVNVSDDDLSWDVSLTYAASDDVNLYTRVARGFRAPTIQGRDVAFFGAPSTAGSEKIRSFEAGVKSELLDQRLRFNAAAFYYTIRGQQLSAIGGGGNFVQLVNADKGVGWGFEVDTEWVLSENLLLTLGLSYNDTELKDDTLAVAPCGSGLCTVLDPLDGNGNALVAGNPFPQAPKVILYATARYSRPVSDEGEMFVSTDWFVQGKTNFFLYESAEFNTSGDFEGGLRLGYSHNGGQYELAFFARNITNEANLKGGIDFNNLTGYVNEPRVLGIEGRFNF